MSDAGHVWPVRIYWEDTDAGGVVYHANYLKFAERARTELLRGRGVDQQKLGQEQGVFLVIRRAEIEFLAPARLGDDLEVVTRVTELRGASTRLEQRIVRPGGAGTIYVQGCTLAAVDRRGRPVRLPAPVRDVLVAVRHEQAHTGA
jgi:acyl-CoA thioester hydrolase